MVTIQQVHDLIRDADPSIEAAIAVNGSGEASLVALADIRSGQTSVPQSFFGPFSGEKQLGVAAANNYEWLVELAAKISSHDENFEHLRERLSHPGASLSHGMSTSLELDDVTDAYEAVDQMVDWFEENYDVFDDDEHVNGEEPKDPREELEFEFAGHVDPAWIDQAVDEIESRGFDRWVERPVDVTSTISDDELWDNAEQAFNKAKKHLARLESILSAIEAAQSGKIGHNNPPNSELPHEPIKPIDGLTLDRLKQTISSWNNASLNDLSISVARPSGLTVVKEAALQTGKWLLEKGDRIADSATEYAGKTIGVGVGGIALASIYRLADELFVELALAEDAMTLVIDLLHRLG